MEHPTPTPQQIAAAVRARLASTKMSVRELSSGTNIPLTTLTRRLNGSPFLSTELAALSRLFDVPVSRLVAEAESIPATTDTEAVA